MNAYYADSLWVEAATDHEAEAERALMAEAKVAAAPILAFVSGAESETDFENRMALMEPNLHAVARGVAGEGTVGYTTIVTALPERLFSDWRIAHEARLVEAQRRNAPRAAARAVARQQTKMAASVPNVTDGQVEKFQRALREIGYVLSDDEAHDILLLNGGYDSAMNQAGVVQDRAADVRGYGDLETGGGWGLSTLVETTDFSSWEVWEDPSAEQRDAMAKALRHFKASTKTAAKPPSRVAGEGAYVTDPHDSSIRKEIAPGTVARPGQGYVTWTGQKVYDWTIDGLGDGWNLGGEWHEQDPASPIGVVSRRTCRTASVENESSRRTSADEGAGGWPLREGINPNFPDEGPEPRLHCPKCDSTEITMGANWGSGGRMGDPGATEFNECRSCGYRTTYAPKNASRRTRRTSAGLSRLDFDFFGWSMTVGSAEANSLLTWLNFAQVAQDGDRRVWNDGQGFEDNWHLVGSADWIDSVAEAFTERGVAKRFMKVKPVKESHRRTASDEYRVTITTVNEEYVYEVEADGESDARSKAEGMAVEDGWPMGRGTTFIERLSSRRAASDDEIATCQHCQQTIARGEGQNRRAWRHSSTPGEGEIKCSDGQNVAEPGTTSIGRFSSRRTASDEPENIALARKVLAEGFYAAGGVLDQFSASAITQVYDALSAENKAKFGALPLVKMVEVAFGLINRTKASANRVSRRVAAAAPFEGEPLVNDDQDPGATAPDGNPPPATPGVNEDQVNQSGGGPGVEVATVAQGDTMLDVANGAVVTYSVDSVTDEGDTVLMSVTKDGTEQMDLRIPKSEQVQVLPQSTNATPEPAVEEPPFEDEPESDDEDDEPEVEDESTDEESDDDEDKKKSKGNPFAASARTARGLSLIGVNDPYGQDNPYVNGTYADGPSVPSAAPPDPTLDPFATVNDPEGDPNNDLTRVPIA